MKNHLLLLTLLLFALFHFTGCDKAKVETPVTPPEEEEIPTKPEPKPDPDNKYYISMWNYLPLEERSEVDAVKEWVDCGISLPMSFEYYWWTDKSLMFKMLDECAEAGLKVIVCDERTTFSRLIWEKQDKGEEAGLEEFKKGVADAMADFGSHPAVYGFHVGDEPYADQWEDAVTAFKIVQDANPSLTAFINMLPYGEDEWFPEKLGCEGMDGYKDKLIDFINRSGARIISYDYYGQCSYVDKEYYQDLYMKNLNLFSYVARETSTKLFVTLLSVGHLWYEVPDEDDFRWQLYTAVAHGAEGIHWFQFYELDQPSASYRGSPINRFGERTQTYEDLSYINRSFNLNFAEKLSECEFMEVTHYGKAYGKFPEFNSNNELIDIQLKQDVFKDIPELAVTKWVDKDGKICYTIVNMGRELPVNFYVYCKDYLNLGHHYELWLAPGQMAYIDKEGIYNN